MYPWARPEDLFVALVLAAGLRLLLRPLPVPAFEPRRVVALGTIAYALAFSFVTVTRHYTFLTHALDLGYYVQLVWNLAGGRGPRVSLPEMHAWGDHLSPIMYVLVPAFWVAPGAVTLLVAQSAALAAGAPAVFLLARRRLGDERTAALFALLYLVNPSLHGMNVRDFHAAALAVPLLLWAFVAAEARRTLLFVGLIVLTLGTREDAALAVIGVGIWLALGQGRWRAGAVTVAGAFALLYVELQWIIPAFRGEPYSHLARYAGLGRSLTEILAGSSSTRSGSSFASPPYRASSISSRCWRRWASSRCWGRAPWRARCPRWPRISSARIPSSFTTARRTRPSCCRSSSWPPSPGTRDCARRARAHPRARRWPSR